MMTTFIKSCNALSALEGFLKCCLSARVGLQQKYLQLGQYLWAFSGNRSYYWIFYSLLIQYWLFFSPWQQQAIIKRLQWVRGMQDLGNARESESATRTCQFPLEGKFILRVFLVTVMAGELKLSQMYVWGNCDQACDLLPTGLLA